MNPNPEPLSPDAPGPLTGSQLNHYIFQSRIGSAGGIDVYRAHDTKLNRDVAIKVLPQLVSGRQRDEAPLYREAQVQASLNHPGIAAIFGIEEDESTTGLIMELVGGESLARRIAQGPQPTELTLEFARQIAEALEAGHERGVAHGDLNADNIVIAPDGRLRILNFGIARILASNERQRDLTAEKRDDIRAWGFVVCELLTGHPIDSGKPDWRQVRRGIPKGFVELLRRAVDDEHPQRLTHIALARHEIDAIRNRANNTQERRAWRRAAVIATAVSVALALLFWRHQESAPASTLVETASAPAGLVPVVPAAPTQTQQTVEVSGTPDARVSVDFDYAGGVEGAFGQSRSGDGGPAAAAIIQPSCVAVDREGTLYISEVGVLASRIRKVENGIITTVAGIGVGGFSGDGGPAISAQLANPQGIAVDKAGNLYIADFGNMRIRKVARNGTITTVAGTGRSGFNGDGIPATSANLNPPQGIAADSNGNLYLAEFDGLNSARIRKITVDGVINTIAGGDSVGFTGDHGPAVSASLAAPYSVVADEEGNVYIAEFGNSRVRKVDPSGVIQTIAGTGARGFNGDGPALAASLAPIGLALGRSGNLYVADMYRIRMLTPNGVLTTVAGNGVSGSGGDGGPATLAQISTPRCMTVDASGDLYIADTGHIRKVSSGTISSVVGGERGRERVTTSIATPGVYKVGNGVTTPQAIQRVMPSYTEDARTAHAKGRVILEAIIRRSGEVRIERVTQSLGYGLDESAVLALREWKFRPGTFGSGGPPVDVTMNIIVTFEPK